mmetsp:Transcript_105128/g.307235  ORF Transcript_105128/g.307235 Transcript_105128/m.307235 type:complete len:216 (+) Transcript_105128:1121-1768(+)
MSPNTFTGASSSNSVGCIKSTCRDWASSALMSPSCSWTCLPGRAPNKSFSIWSKSTVKVVPEGGATDGRCCAPPRVVDPVLLVIPAVEPPPFSCQPPGTTGCAGAGGRLANMAGCGRGNSATGGSAIWGGSAGPSKRRASAVRQRSMAWGPKLPSPKRVTSWQSTQGSVRSQPSAVFTPCKSTTIMWPCVASCVQRMNFIKGSGASGSHQPILLE